MTAPAIRVENVSKCFRIGSAMDNRQTFREAIMKSVAAPAQKIARLFRAGSRKPEYEDFWALKDVSFEVPRGEAVGIIGRNGAGKSTLLKVLSKITDPTEGRIEMRGRVASLLEVGIGFHPELTGRENIFLNGAILGMQRTEILRKFDEIVAFAEVEKFLDTPVKHYSSGMYLRLAFAVAAHLESDVLLVDEVLAVGDAQFQKKCLGKMGDVAREGRTVLFVSHNMEAVLKFCKRGVVLKNGQTSFVGNAAEAVEHYQRSNAGEISSQYENKQTPERPHFKSIRLINTQINYGDCIEIEADLGSSKDSEAAVEVEIRDERDLPLIYVSTSPMYHRVLKINAGQSNPYRIKIGPLPLASGEYQMYFWLIKPWTETYDTLHNSLRFTVETSDPHSTGFNFKQAYSRGAFTVPMEVVEPGT